MYHTQGKDSSQVGQAIWPSLLEQTPLLCPDCQVICHPLSNGQVTEHASSPSNPAVP